MLLCFKNVLATEKGYAATWSVTSSSFTVIPAKAA
jgi:hypothetical protein